jgi:threonyl-tRNA synthetase
MRAADDHEIAPASAQPAEPGQLTVTLPDGSSRVLAAGSTAADLAKAIGARLARDAIAAEVDGQLTDLSAPLHDGSEVRIVTAASDEGREVLRHSTAHVMAQAVLDLWPGAHFAIGPAIADGFYYDFELPGGVHFHEGDLARVEARMREIIDEAQPFVRRELHVAEALELFADQPFKVEIIEGVAGAGDAADAALLAETAAVPAGAAAPVISTYTNPSAARRGGPFVDLCRGPHVPSTDRLGHFRLTRLAGAYWRGDDRREQLQRIYGAAFESAQALADHLRRLEEAELRDHRRLGVELDLFSFPEEIGSGLAVFHPKGGLVRKLMEDYARTRHEEAGYSFVSSPHITKSGLFETSGHLEWFAEGMFPPMELDGGQRYYLKPMNCPFHILIYRSRQRSYRELPMRLFEFGTVYRYEKSGVVHGLTRVRGMTQDDAHIFCTRAQMRDEITSLLSFVLELLRDYGLEEFYLELSTRPEGKVVGSDEEWEEATSILRAAGESMGLELVLDPGGGAFYAPKISVQARDAIGRTWQLSTIQVDLQEPQRFGLEYVSADNSRERPVMIHRALFGSVERFFAVLLEHYAGAFPTWLAPVQAAVLPVRDAHAGYAGEVVSALRAAGLRTETLGADEPLGGRVRRAKHVEKVPYVLVVGDQDVASRTVGVNPRSGSEERGVPLGSVVERLAAESSPPSRRAR